MINYEKTFQGAHKFSVSGYHSFTRQYFGYTKIEASKLFREDRLLDFLKRNKGWVTILFTERKTAERLELKGKIEIARHGNKASWQVKLKKG